MPVGLGIVQIGRINVYDTISTFVSLTPISGNAFCSSPISFIVNVQNTTTPSHSTLIDIGSDNVSLPTSTISVISTSGFPPAGQIFISDVNTLVSYTGITSNSFTGCTDGYGTLLINQGVTSAPFPPQGVVFIQDLITDTIFIAGTGYLVPFDPSNSRVTLTPRIPIGSYNIVAFYIGQDGNSYDILHQFKPSQSGQTLYSVVQSVTTTTTVIGPNSFEHISSPSYSITVLSSSLPSPSVGMVTLTGQQDSNSAIVIGSGIPTNGEIVIVIPSNTFVVGSLTITAVYTDLVDKCYGSSLGTLNVTIT